MATFDFAAWRRRKQLRGEWIGWKEHTHNHKKVIRGLTDEELFDAIKFIFPAEEEDTKEKDSNSHGPTGRVSRL